MTFISYKSQLAHFCYYVQDLESYNFEKFVADFGMKYTAQEIETRKSIFNAELGIL